MKRGKPLMNRSAANRYDLSDVRSSVWTIAVLDLCITFVSIVLFVVLLFTPPMNPLLLYMLMNLLHLFISPLLFFSVNRNSISMVTYVIYWMGLVFSLDVITFFIRTIEFGRCHNCLHKGYLLGTLFPYAINFVYLVTDSLVFWKLYSLKAAMRFDEATNAFGQGMDGVSTTSIYDNNNGDGNGFGSYRQDTGSLYPDLGAYGEQRPYPPPTDLPSYAPLPMRYISQDGTGQYDYSQQSNQLWQQQQQQHTYGRRYDTGDDDGRFEVLHPNPKWNQV